MKTTNGKAFEILVTLAALQETGRLGYAIAKQRRIIETELKEFIDIRNRAIMAHMTDGKMSEDGAAAANAEIADVIDMPCEFAVYSVPEEVFTSGGLTAPQMYQLDFMVEVGNDGE